MRSPSRAVRGVFVFGLLVIPAVFLSSLRTSGQVIVPAGEVVGEDLYAISGSTRIEGTVAGDLFVITGSLTITGDVDGDVVGIVGGPVEISGEVAGSVRVAAVRLDVSGRVEDDLVVVVAESSVPGSVGRDLLAIAGSIDLGGQVGRDVRSQAFRMEVGGTVGRDVLVRVDRLSVGSGVVVGGDLLYKASREAEVASGVTVGGVLTRRTVIAPVWAKALSRALAVLSLLGFIVAGLIGAWLFRGLSSRALEEAAARPGRSALIGLGLAVVPPLLVVPLFLSLVGIPIALLLLVGWLLALMLGPLPAVTALGRTVTRGRGGIALAILVGALVWRGAMWALPLIAAVLYVGFLVVGLGAYGTAAWSLRSEHPAQA